MVINPASPFGLLDATMDRIASEMSNSLTILEAWKTRKGHKLSAAHKAAISAALKGKGKGKASAGGGGGGAGAAGVDPTAVKGQVGETVKFPDGTTGTISKMQGKAWAAVEGGSKKWWPVKDLKPVDPPAKAADAPSTLKTAGAAKAFDPATGKGVTGLKAAHPVGSMIKTPHGDFEVTKHTTGYVQVTGGPKKWYTTDELAAHSAAQAGKPAPAAAPVAKAAEAPKATPAAAPAVKPKNVTTVNVKELLSSSGVDESKPYTKAIATGGSKIASKFVKTDGSGYKVTTSGGVTKIDIVAGGSGASYKANIAKIKSHLDKHGLDYSDNGFGTITLKSNTFTPGAGPKPGASPHAIGDVVKYPGTSAKYTVSAIHNDGSVSLYPEGNPFAHVTHSASPLMSDKLELVSKAADAAPKSEFPASPTGLKTVQTLGGSTGAKLVEDVAGNKFVSKQGANAEHVKAEYHADRVYEAAGANVPKGQLYDGASPTKLTTYLDGAKPLSSLKGAELAAAHAELKKSFVLDAIMGNRDVIGMGADNVMVGKDGKVYRIDNGGSFDFRAQGQKKEFGSKVTELDSMLNPSINPQTAAVFKGLTAKEVHDQALALKANEAKILAATPPQYKAAMQARIDDAVAQSKAKLDVSNASQQLDTPAAPKTVDLAQAPWNKPAAGHTTKLIDGTSLKAGDSFKDKSGHEYFIDKVHPDGTVDMVGKASGNVFSAYNIATMNGTSKVGAETTLGAKKAPESGWEDVPNKTKHPSTGEAAPAAPVAKPLANGATVEHPTYGKIHITNIWQSGAVHGVDSNGYSASFTADQAKNLHVVHAADEPKYFAASAPGKKALEAMHPVGSKIITPDGAFRVTKHTTGMIQVEGGPKKWYKSEELAAAASTPAAIKAVGSEAKPTAPAISHAIKGGTATVGDTIKTPNGNEYKITGTSPDGFVTMVKTANVTGMGVPIGGTTILSSADMAQTTKVNTTPAADAPTGKTTLIPKELGYMSASQVSGVPHAYTGTDTVASSSHVDPTPAHVKAALSVNQAPAEASSYGGVGKYSVGKSPNEGQAVWYGAGGTPATFVKHAGDGQNAVIKTPNGDVKVPYSSLKPFDHAMYSAPKAPTASGVSPFTPKIGWPTKMVKGENTLHDPTWIAQQNAMIATWPAANKAAVVKYTGSSTYPAINDHLRYGKAATPATLNEIAKMDKVMNTSKTDRDMIVYRGIGNDYTTGKPIPLAVGQVFQEKGYMSTSVSSGSEFGGSTKFEIMLPQGAKGAYVKAISHHGSEQEFLLARDAKFMVHEIVQVGGVRHVRMEYISE